MLRSTLLIGTLVAGIASAADAGEPVRLTDQDLDSVTGAYNFVGSISLSGPSTVFGNVATFSALTFTNLQSQTLIDAPNFLSSTSTQGIARVRATSSGFGVGGSNASAGSYSAIILN